jgi:fused signal recognition particle receptor
VSSESQSQRSSGFLRKLRQRLNRGAAWVSGDIGRLLQAPSLDSETLEALEDQLLLADVGVEATDWLLRRIQSGRDDTDARSLLGSAVTELLRPLEAPLVIDDAHSPYVIFVLGVNGVGKTTSIGKLAHRLRRSGKSVLIAAGDTFRAAAVEQLREWADRADAPIVSQAPGADPAAVVHDALHAARARGVDVVIADTAGRLHTASGLMDELAKIKRVMTRFDPSAPHEVLLVLDASQGQNGLAQAAEFHRRLGVTGLVLAKLDGTAKGGIALAIARELRLPIRFVGIGESLEDFDVFDAEQFSAALTGVGNE